MPDRERFEFRVEKFVQQPLSAASFRLVLKRPTCVMQLPGNFAPFVQEIVAAIAYFQTQLLRVGC